MHARHQKRHAPNSSHGTGSTVRKMVANVSVDENHNGQTVTADEIRLCAYRKWEQAGKPTGDGVRYWLEAEQELTQCK